MLTEGWEFKNKFVSLGIIKKGYGKAIINKTI